MKESLSFGRDVGTKVRHFRLEKGLSQDQLAFDCRLNTNSIGMIERGQKNPTIFTLKRICDSLEISLAALFLYDKTTTSASNEAAIRKVADLMRQMSPADAERVANVVEQLSFIGKSNL